MRRVLVLAFQFPPEGGSGVQRTAKFCKYLPEFGWCPEVVTQGVTHPGRECDPSLLKDVSNVRLHGTDSVHSCDTILKSAIFHFCKLPGTWRFRQWLNRQLLYPDSVYSWIDHAVKVSRPLLKLGEFDLLYSTSPPHSAQLAARALKREFGLPWVADFRDPWTGNRIIHGSSWELSTYLGLPYERSVYQEADMIVANTETNRTNLVELHSVATECVTTIYNGYDEADFPEFDTAPPVDRFRITLCSSAYAGYTPDDLVKVMARFLELRPHERVQWTIAGGASEWARKSIDLSNIQKTLDLRGYVPHEQVPPMLASSNVLFVSLPSSAGYCVPAKVFEYLRSQTPILAIGSRPSEVDKILTKTSGGKLFQHDELDEAAKWLVEMYDQWEKSGTPQPGALNEEVRRYDRRTQAKQLAEVFDRLVDNNSRIDF